MQVARRVYIYLVTFISLQMLLAGASTLLRLLFEMALGIQQDVLNSAGYLREQFSLSGSITLVGALVWIVHWILAQRSVAPSNPDAGRERLSILRKLLIYAVLFVSLWQIFFAVGGLVRELALALVSTSTKTPGLAPADYLPTILVYGVAWLYYWRVRNRDNSLTPEDGRAATARRWYFYLVSYGTLSVLMATASDLARQVWRDITGAQGSFALGSSGASSALAGDAAWIVVSLAAWLAHWLAAQRLTRASVDEQHSMLRKVYLYLMVLQTLSVTMTTLAIFLNSVLRLILGTNPLGNSGDSLLAQAGGPLITALVYGLFWAYHWQVLKWDAALVAEEPPRQASIRRAYYYLVALVGLAVLAGGVSSLIQLLISLPGRNFDTILGRQAIGDQISLAATLIVVGAPVWYVNWSRLQRRALALDGSEERHALLRRIYVYVIIFFSVVTLLASAGTLVYQLLLAVGGAPGGDLLNNLAGALGPTITAGVILAYHLRVLISDQRAVPAMPPPLSASAPEPTTVEAMQGAPAPSMVLLVRFADAPGLDAALEEFRGKLPPGSRVDAFPVRNLAPEELGWRLAGPYLGEAAPAYVQESPPPRRRPAATVQQPEPPPQVP